MAQAYSHKEFGQQHESPQHSHLSSSLPRRKNDLVLVAQSGIEHNCANKKLGENYASTTSNTGKWHTYQIQSLDVTATQCKLSGFLGIGVSRNLPASM
jgi:hypothetical protein